MKFVTPVILLGLAGATAACTFEFISLRDEKFGDAETRCKVRILLDDGYLVAEDRPDDCTKKDLCFDIEEENAGGKYTACLDGSINKDGKVDGDITIQRDGGTQVNIKPDGEEDISDEIANYFIDNVECPGAKEPEPSGK